MRNSQLVISEHKLKNGLTLEKSIDLESYFCQSCVGLDFDTTSASTSIVFGCSDGFVRIFSLTTSSIAYAERLHQTSILNLVLRKNKTLISLSAESKTKINLI